MDSENNSIWRKWFKREQQEKPESARKMAFPRTEKITAFIVAFAIALGLWLLVNLGREYTLTVQIPLNIASLDEEYALVEELPEYVEATILAEGWKLLNVYNNPPAVPVNPSPEPLNVYELVQEQMNIYPEVNIQQVEPSTLNLNIEERVSRRLPVKPNIEVNFRRQYNFKSEPVVNPDSVTVSGARSLVDGLSGVNTKSYEFNELDSDIEAELELESPSGLIQMGRRTVDFIAEVAEFTEAEVRLLIRVRGIPENEEVRFSPSVITVRYDVPIDQFAQTQESMPYEAYVDYEELERDTTGSVTPTITTTMDELNLRLRSYQPRSVSYYKVVEN